jgi:hypothetical protein
VIDQHCDLAFEWSSVAARTSANESDDLLRTKKNKQTL